MILRCPNCRAIVTETDEVCPICQHTVPPEARDPSSAPPPIASPPPRTRPRSGRIAVRVLAVAGWLVAIAVVAAVVSAWVL